MATKSHFGDPMSTDPERIGGYSRKSCDASFATKTAVINAIRNWGDKYGLSQLDVANLIAMASVESGFNPDAATTDPISSASGVMQVTDYWAGRLYNKYDGTARINGHQLGVYDRFDVDSNIEYGIGLYLDAKAIAKSSDVGDIYAKYHGGDPETYLKYLNRLRTQSARYLQGLQNGETSGELLTDFPICGPKKRVCTPDDLDGNGIPDYVDDIRRKVKKASVTKSPIALKLKGSASHLILQNHATSPTH